MGCLNYSNSVSLDRPLPPRNIVVSDIKAESCYLTWDAPEDNGGSDLTNYIIEKRDASKKKSDWEQLTCCIMDRRYGVNNIVHMRVCLLHTVLCTCNSHLNFFLSIFEGIQVGGLWYLPVPDQS